MKRIILKVLLALFVTFLFGVPAFIFWMRAGEEKPLDYSALDFELGPQDSEINGYTYLREFCEENEADIPENYPYDFERDIDYSLYENWDLGFFEQILESNKEFMAGIEAAFDRPKFMADQEFSPETILLHVGELRHYVTLRLIKARVLHLMGNNEAALVEVADLANEIEMHTKSGGALIGFLTSIAMNGVLVADLWAYQANADLSPKQLKAFARDYDTAEHIANSAQFVIKQEFQFLKNATDEVSKLGVINYDLGFFGPPSKAEILFHQIFQYIGWRENRTVNEIFLTYTEMIEQLDLPSSQRRFNYPAKMEASLSRRDWGAFLNRNPYGHMMFSTLLPTIRKTFDITAKAEASTSATRISFALQACYLERGALPENLNELVPDYLAAIPRDPFDGEPMRYSKEKKIVYSVGNDFVDQGGSEELFIFQMDPDDNYEAAEHDDTEPTFPLRFAM